MITFCISVSFITLYAFVIVTDEVPVNRTIVTLLLPVPPKNPDPVTVNVAALLYTTAAGLILLMTGASTEFGIQTFRLHIFSEYPFFTTFMGPGVKDWLSILKK